MKLALFVVIVLAGCSSPGVSVSQTDNKNFNVEKLFTNDNCAIYRFFDGGDAIYYADCHGESHASWNQLHGKIYVPMNVSTGEN